MRAIDGDRAAVAALATAAGELPQVTAECRDLVRAPLQPAELARFVAAVFDPPRAGAAA